PCLVQAPPKAPKAPKERQPAGRPSTPVKSVSALALVHISSNSPRIGSTHAATLTNWVLGWVPTGAQRGHTSPSSPPVPDFLSVSGETGRGVVWSTSPDWPVMVRVLAGARKQEIEGPGLEQGTICLEA
ncbi:hypothetical protein CORC01_11652, partial [Colletotrichum orchidophilum]